MLKSLSLILIRVLIGGHLLAQSWTQLNPSGQIPPGLGGHAAAYDAVNNRLMTFGGRPLGGDLTNNVWVLTNANGSGGAPVWTQLAPSGALPPPKTDASAVFDQSSNRLIVFAGYTTTSVVDMNDVWVLTNANGLGGTPQWIQLNPPGDLPQARRAHGAVYDAATNRMIIFGGGFGTFASMLNDTWVLSNANGIGGAPQWTQITPVAGQLPPTRCCGAMGYDPATNRLIVFGGNQGIGKLNDTWVLSNANGQGGAAQWNQLPTTGNVPMWYDEPAAYNPATNQLVATLGVTGGPDSGLATTSTWLLSNANGNGIPTWTQVSTTGGLPPKRDGLAGMRAFDANTNRLIVFGGTDSTSLNDVWVLNLNVGDATPPVVTPSVAPAPNGAGWNNSLVTVAWNLSDPESGVSSSTGCATTMLTSETPVTGVTLTCSATNGVGQTTSAPVTIKIDKTNPAVTLSAPASGASYVVGSSLSASYSCSDGLSGIATCTGGQPNGSALSTATVGPQNFSVTATDTAGNQSIVSNGYNIIYTFSGFLPPIVNPPSTNGVKAGQTVPVKWQLRDSSGNYISDLSSVVALGASPVACDDSLTAAGAGTDSTGGTTLRYDSTAQQFIYNWQTNKSASGCYQLQLTLKDGTIHSAKFSFSH